VNSDPNPYAPPAEQSADENRVVQLRYELDEELLICAYEDELLSRWSVPAMLNQFIFAWTIFSSIVGLSVLGGILQSLDIGVGGVILVVVVLVCLVVGQLVVFGRLSNRFLRNSARHRLKELRRKFPELTPGHWLVTVERRKVIVMTTAAPPREFPLSELDIRTTVGPNRRFNNGLALRHSSSFIIYIPRSADCEEPLPAIRSLIKGRRET
jgi:hypothetical protein